MAGADTGTGADVKKILQAKLGEVSPESKAVTVHFQGPYHHDKPHLKAMEIHKVLGIGIEEKVGNCRIWSDYDP
ncbi:hypothetical protein V6N11_048001 [Hibiscus sabdariffa]|uniref:Uncharacterized protein n=1 Tax=Hibiscus sabdariffa TaxID=183260 RepID=A0ABR2NXI6_9ROSI